MVRRILVAFGLSVVVVVLGQVAPAVAGGGGHGACDGFARDATVVMRDICFQGVAHFVEPGATVTVRNEGNMPHDIVAVDGSFRSPRLSPGQTFEIRVDEPGVVPFYCSLHGSVAGTAMSGVFVVDAPADARDAALASATTDRASTPAAVVQTSRDETFALVLAAVATFAAGGALAVGLVGRVRSPR